MNKLEIFIAGSKALEEERAWVRNVASNLIADYNRKGVVMHYAIYDYTNFDLAFDTDGQQENYNKYIANQADLVIFILDKNVGDKTLGEFNVAYGAYSTRKRPMICIFSNKQNKGDANINNIRARVTQVNQYYNEYETREQLERMVDKLLRDCSDPIIAKSTRRKNIKTLLSVVAVAIIAIAGVLAYTFNNTSKTADVAPSQVVEQVVVEKSTTNATKRAATQKATPTPQKQPVAAQPAQSTASKAVTTTEKPQEEVVAQPKPSLQSLAEAGDMAACYELATKYQTGNGVAKSKNQAFKYMKMAAEGGYGKAYRPLAEMYHKGEGVTKDRDEAAVWYKRAADNGDRKALYILNNL